MTFHQFQGAVEILYRGKVRLLRQSSLNSSFWITLAHNFVPVLLCSELQDIEEHTAEYTSRFANPLVAAQRGFVDDVIDPQDTRKFICNDLRVLRSKKMPDIPKKHSNIPL